MLVLVPFGTLPHTIENGGNRLFRNIPATYTVELS